MFSGWRSDMPVHVEKALVVSYCHTQLMLNSFKRLSDRHCPGREGHDLVLGVKSDDRHYGQEKRDQIMFNLLHRLCIIS